MSKPPSPPLSKILAPGIRQFFKCNGVTSLLPPLASTQFLYSQANTELRGNNLGFNHYFAEQLVLLTEDSLGVMGILDRSYMYIE